MKKLLTGIAVILSLNSFSQQNLLNETGNVGIGTTAPTSKLDVKGKVKIDSTLTVKDSLIVQKTLKVVNTTILSNGLKLNGLQQRNVLNSTDRVLIIDDLGNISKGPANLGNVGNGLGIGNGGVLPGNGNNCNPNNQGNISNPAWGNGVNKLFSPCPQVNVGINTENPRVKLDVYGTIYGNKMALGISDPTTLSQYNYFTLRMPDNISNQTLFKIENNYYDLFTVSSEGRVYMRALDMRTV